MQWRMVGRRGRVGDLDRRRRPGAVVVAGARRRPRRAREEALGDKPRHDFHLSTNYRNSKEIYDFAAAYADRVGLDADLPNAVRATGVEPAERHGRRPARGRPREAVTELAGAVEGTVGIVVPVGPAGAGAGLARRLDGARRGRGRRRLARIAVLTGLDTKGLEFDGIVVVAPDEIEAESSTGRATLYVVLTRATQRMVTVTT